MVKTFPCQSINDFIDLMKVYLLKAAYIYWLVITGISLHEKVTIIVGYYIIFLKRSNSFHTVYVNSGYRDKYYPKAPLCACLVMLDIVKTQNLQVFYPNKHSCDFQLQNWTCWISSELYSKSANKRTNLTRSCFSEFPNLNHQPISSLYLKLKFTIFLSNMKSLSVYTCVVERPSQNVFFWQWHDINWPMSPLR